MENLQKFWKQELSYYITVNDRLTYLFPFYFLLTYLHSCVLELVHYYWYFILVFIYLHDYTNFRKNCLNFFLIIILFILFHYYWLKRYLSHKWRDIKNEYSGCLNFSPNSFSFLLFFHSFNACIFKLKLWLVIFSFISF